ncbi:MAG: hypothetical protein AAF790_04625, partial [Planctomycetota bacterium]
TDETAAVGDITLGDAGEFFAGTLRFNAPGAVTIQEDASLDDPDTAVTLTNTAGTLLLRADGPLTDTPGVATEIRVQGGATFVTTGSLQPIVLNDSAGDVLTVGGLAAFAGASISVGQDGSAGPGGPPDAAFFAAGTLNFNAAGDVAIEEDATPLDPGTAVTLGNTARDLRLSSDGPITDLPGTTITVGRDATLTARGPGGSADIVLADTAGDTLIVQGLAAFRAGDEILIGPAGVANFGTLSLVGNTPAGFADTATVFEDSSTSFDQVRVRELTLRAAGGITDIDTAAINVLETATLDTGLPVEDVVLGDAGAELRLGTVRFFGDEAISGDADRQVAQHVSLQEQDGFVVGDARVAGTYFATAAGGSIVQQLNPPGGGRGMPTPATLEAAALGLRTPGGAAILYRADVGRFAAEAGGSLDVAATTGGLLARLTDERITDDAGLAPTALDESTGALVRLDVDSQFGVLLLRHTGDLLIGAVADASAEAAAGQADGVRSAAGHAFVEAVAMPPGGPGGAGGEAGNIVFDAQDTPDSRAVLMGGDHVFTAVAAGTLSINTLTATELAATGTLGGGTGVVTDVARYTSYDDRDGFTTRVTDTVAGDVEKEGVLLQVTPPSEELNAATTRIVGESTQAPDGTPTPNVQGVEITVGRPGEANLIVQITWADRELPGEAPGAITRVAGQPPVEASYVDAGTERRTHEFTDAFLSVENAGRDYGDQGLAIRDFDLPTNIVVLSDPRINLFSEGGAQNLNRSVTPTDAATPVRADNFVLARAQKIGVTQEDLGATEPPTVFDPPPILAAPELSNPPLLQQAFEPRVAAAAQEGLEIEYGPLDAELAERGEREIIDGAATPWKEPANYVAAIKQQVIEDPNRPAGRYIIKATSGNKSEPDVTEFEKKSTVANPYDGAAVASDTAAGVADFGPTREALPDADAWTAAWIDWASEADALGADALGTDAVSPEATPKAGHDAEKPAYDGFAPADAFSAPGATPTIGAGIEARRSPAGNPPRAGSAAAIDQHAAAAGVDDTGVAVAGADALMVGGVLLSRRGVKRGADQPAQPRRPR